MRKLIIIILLLSATASASIFINSFNSGQLSKDLKHRHDLDKTAMGSEELENILIRPQGMAFRRPGTEFIDTQMGTTGVSTPEVLGDYPTLNTTTDQADPGLTHTTPISTLTDLANMANNLNGNYYLTGNIDASGTAAPGYNSGYGWQPIGGWNDANPFIGTFDGCGYTITGLYINRDYVLGAWGLFGTINSPAKIANVTLANVDISGSRQANGALVGIAVATTTDGILIQNCHSSGDIKSSFVTPLYNGGLIGKTNSPGGSVTKIVYVYDCSSSCAVNGSTAGQTYAWGGLIGASKYTVVQNCFATGNVTGADGGAYHGGLIGLLGGGVSDTVTQVSYCYATGNVTGEDWTGGFVGFLTVGSGGYMRRCYSTGNVSSSDPTSNTNLGGFAGAIAGVVTDCYSWGDVTMDSGTPTGGFVGVGGTLTNCYSIGLVTSDGLVYGGFSGSGGTQVSCYWDTETSGQATSGGDEVGHTTTWMKTRSNFEDAGWDISGGTSTIWYQEYTAAVDTLVDLTGLPVRLIPFEFSTNDAYVIELGHKYLSFLRTTQ